MNSFSSYFTSSFQAKTIIISVFVRLLTVSLAFISYFLIQSFLAVETSLILEIGLILSALISLILFAPIQENLEIYLKKKFLSEYIFEDALTLKSARRKFEINALISNIFPDMVKISGNESGKILILSSDGENYDSYSYEKGKRKKMKSGSILVNKALSNQLIKKVNGYSTYESLGLTEINDEFIKYNANYMIPFLFREKLFGFLAIPNIPSEEVIQTLKILSSKSALAIYNNILSSQIAIHQKYKREFATAVKIEKHIFDYKIPNFRNIEITSFRRQTSMLLEFFDGMNGEKLFLVLAIKNNISGSEIVFSYILGKIYSLTINSQSFDIKTLKLEVDAIFNELSFEDNYELTIGSFKENSSKLTFLLIGKNIKITNDINSNLSLVSSGWRYTVDLEKTKELFIIYKSEKVFSIKAK